MNLAHHIRHTHLINPINFNQSISVIGAGSIGSWTTLALAKMGCSEIHVYDNDAVEEHNMGPQFYSVNQINDSKVLSLLGQINESLGEEVVKGHNFQIEEDSEPFTTPIVISGVDSIASRKEILEVIKRSPEVQYYIDGRMEANELQIFSFKPNNEEAMKKYEASLFSEESATPIACSARSVIYNCLIVSGLITDVVAHIVNRDEVPFLLEADLKNFTLFGGLV